MDILEYEPNEKIHNKVVILMPLFMANEKIS